MIAQNLEQIQRQAIPDFKFAGATIGDVVSKLVPYLFVMAGLLLLLYLLYGGISLMLSGGDPKAIHSAKDKITGAVIGFIIVCASFWIVELVSRLLGITIISRIF